MATQITSDITEQLDYNDDCVVQTQPESAANEEGELTDERDVETGEKTVATKAAELEDGELSDEGALDGDTAANHQHNWTPSGWRPGYCKFFMSNRGCRFGSHCRYIHPDPADLRNAGDRNESAAKIVTSDVDTKPDATSAAPQTAAESENAAPKNDQSTEQLTTTTAAATTATTTEDATAATEDADKSENKVVEKSDAPVQPQSETKPAEPVNRPRIVFAQAGTGAQRDTEWLKALARARDLHRRAKQRKLDADPDSLREKNLNASLVEPSTKQPAAQAEANIHVEYGDTDEIYSDAFRPRVSGASLIETLDDVPSVDEATRELNELRRRKQTETNWKHIEERRERERERERDRVRERDRDRLRDRDRDRDRDHDRDRFRQPRTRDRAEDPHAHRDRDRVASRTQDADARKRRRAGAASASDTDSDSDSDSPSPANAGGVAANKQRRAADASTNSGTAKRKAMRSQSSSSTDSDSDSDLSSSQSDSSDSEAARDRNRQPKRAALDSAKKRKVDDATSNRGRAAASSSKRRDDTSLKRGDAAASKRGNDDAADKKRSSAGDASAAKTKDRERTAATGTDRRAAPDATASTWHRELSTRDRQSGVTQPRAASLSASDSDSDAATRRRKRVSKFESEQGSTARQQSAATAQKRSNVTEKARAGATGASTAAEKYSDVKPTTNSTTKVDDDSRRGTAGAPSDKDAVKSLKRSELMKKLSDVQAALDRTQARIHKSRDSK